MFPYSKMTLLGDINQAIYSHTASDSIPLSNRIEQNASVETYVLNQTYRSTKPIVEFTSFLIKEGHTIEPFNREGNKPTVKVVSERVELTSHLLNQIKSV